MPGLKLKVEIPNDNFTLTLPIAGTSVWSVIWGDSTSDLDVESHTYTTAGQYNVVISGLEGNVIYFDMDRTVDPIPQASRNAIIQVLDWGDEFIGKISFEECINLTIDIETGGSIAPNFTNGASIANIFKFCENFNSDNVEGWDVSAVADMSGAFYSAFAFNQNLGGWDVSAVENFSNMFKNASSFNRYIGSWNLASATDASGMLDNSAISIPNYALILEGWVSNSPASNITLGAEGLYYDYANSPNRDLLIAAPFSWNIVGDIPIVVVTLENYDPTKVYTADIKDFPSLVQATLTYSVANTWTDPAFSITPEGIITISPALQGPIPLYLNLTNTDAFDKPNVTGVGEGTLQYLVIYGLKVKASFDDIEDLTVEFSDNIDIFEYLNTYKTDTGRNFDNNDIAIQISEGDGTYDPVTGVLTPPPAPSQLTFRIGIKAYNQSLYNSDFGSEDYYFDVIIIEPVMVPPQNDTYTPKKIIGYGFPASSEGRIGDYFVDALTGIKYGPKTSTLGWNISRTVASDWRIYAFLMVVLICITGIIMLLK